MRARFGRSAKAAGTLAATLALAASALVAPRAPLALLGAGGALLGIMGCISLSSLASTNLLTFASFLSGIAIPLGPLHVRPEQVIAPLVLTAVLLKRLYGRFPREGILVLLWILSGLCGAVGEPEPGRALVHAVRLFATVLPFFLIPFLLPREDLAESGWNGFLFLAAVEATCGLLARGSHLVFGTSWGITSAWGLGYVHPHGTLLEPNILGALSAAAAVPLVLRLLTSRLAPRVRVVAAFGALVLILAVAVSLTRAAWIALPSVLALLLAIRFVTSPQEPLVLRRRAFTLGASMLLTLVGSFFLFTLLPARDALETRSGVLGKIVSLRSLADDPNVRVRVRSYEEALKVWRSSPLFGAGHGAMERLAGGEDRELAWAGNLEVHLLVDSGLVGLGLFLAFLARVLWVAARSITRSSTDASRESGLERLGALLVLLVCAQATETSWLASFWVVMGLALAGRAPDLDRAKHSREAGALRSSSAGTARPPLRILYVHPSDELYGSDRVLLDLVERLDRRRFVPLVLLSSDVSYAGRLSQKLVAQGVAVRRLRIGVLRRRVLTSPWRAARYAFDVARSTIQITALVRSERIDLVHANTVTVFPAAVAARLSGRRLVWHLHEIVTDRPGRALLHFLVRSLAHRIVVVSEASRASLGDTGFEAQVISNGIAPRALSPPPVEPPVIAYIGRLSERKGPHVLLRAAARVLATHPETRFLLAGDEFDGGDALGRELSAEAEQLGISHAVAIRPFSEDVSTLLAEVAIVVSPSILPESFGLILLEAMASGRPVVASAHGGPSELIVEGETGFLVPPGDAVALAAALDRLLGDASLRQRLGEAGRVRAELRYPISESVRRFETIYEELAG